MLIDGLINLLPAAAVFWLLNAWSLTHGHFWIHVWYTSGYARHVYGLNPFGLMAWLLIVSLSWGVLMGRLPGPLDALWALVDSENRTWHDIACRTHVVRVGQDPPLWQP